MDTLKIIGISTVTTNQNGQAATDLGQLWGRFSTEQVMDKIPGKLSTEVYSVYTDYESNYLGHYTTIIGARVVSLAEIPEGMTGREFDPIKFEKFTAKGTMPGAVVATWQQGTTMQNLTALTYTITKFTATAANWAINQKLIFL